MQQTMQPGAEERAGAGGLDGEGENRHYVVQSEWVMISAAAVRSVLDKLSVGLFECWEEDLQRGAPILARSVAVSWGA